MLNLRCPAKLNLDLKVIRRRSDGMHDIESRFQLVDLFDEMEIIKNSSFVNTITTNLEASIDNEKNIVWHAINALKNYSNQEIFCDIYIEKNIPIGGGMGGGSSNAAAALIGVNELYSLKLSLAQLMEIGKKLGADIPFFLFGRNAMASGIGDKLIPEVSSKKKFLILLPNIQTSTKDMFTQWDALDLNKSVVSDSPDKNAFLQLFLETNKEIKDIFEEISYITPLELSGTGSTLFYAYDDLQDIEKTLKKIPTKWRHFFCEPLQCSPLLSYLT